MQVFILNQWALDNERSPWPLVQSVWSTHEKAREAAERIEAGRAGHVIFDDDHQIESFMNSNDGRGKTAFTITVETVDPTNI